MEVKRRRDREKVSLEQVNPNESHEILSIVFAPASRDLGAACHVIRVKVADAGVTLVARVTSLVGSGSRKCCCLFSLRSKREREAGRTNPLAQSDRLIS